METIKENVTLREEQINRLLRDILTLVNSREDCTPGEIITALTFAIDTIKTQHTAGVIHDLMQREKGDGEASNKTDDQ